jgi:hypothetical protein
MTSRERLLAVLHGEVPDCVPCCPDISNMVPCRLTGKPFWDIYAHQDPPLWKAHIDALKYFDIDGGFEIYSFGPVDPVTGDSWMPEERIVQRNADGSFVTQHFYAGSESWAPLRTASGSMTRHSWPRLTPSPSTATTCAGVAVRCH